MDSILEDLQRLDPFVRSNKEGEQLWMSHLKTLYDKFSSDQSSHEIFRPSGVLDALHITDLDNEQIWQQVELLNNSIYDKQYLLDFETSSLSVKVEYLHSLSCEDPLLGLKNNSTTELDSHVTNHDGSSSSADLNISNEGLRSGEDYDSDVDQSDDEDDLSDNEDNEDVNNSNIDDDEEELGVDNDVQELLENLSDSDADEEFGDLAIGDDGSESESDNDINREREADDQLESEDTLNVDNKDSVKFSKTSVDSEFLKVRESEWIADNDLIGENCQNNFEDIDFMSDLGDDEEENDNVMYRDFFGDDKGKSSSIRKQKQPEDDDSESSEEDDDAHSTSDNECESQEAEVDEIKTENKSFYEKMEERNKKQYELLEDNNIADKDWVLKGEIQSADRPENSVLEQDLEYTVTASQRPATTVEITQQLEKFIIGVVRSGAFDDVERKVKPINDPNSFKKTLLLDQGKSQKSLAEIYEQEYIKQKESNKRDENEEEPPEHKEIKNRMNSLFTMLDALANYHYTPRQKNAEIKIVSNLPAICLEESTPASVNDAALLAPQEVVSSKKGDIIGKTEKTVTDKKRERRKKKNYQKSKAQAEEIKLKKKLQKISKSDKSLDVSTSVKVVEKAVKRGQIKLMEKQSSNKGKSLMDKNMNNKKRKSMEFNQSKSKRNKTCIESTTKLLI